MNDEKNGGQARTALARLLTRPYADAARMSHRQCVFRVGPPRDGTYIVYAASVCQALHSAFCASPKSGHGRSKTLPRICAYLGAARRRERRNRLRHGYVRQRLPRQQETCLSGVAQRCQDCRSATHLPAASDAGPRPQVSSLYGLCQARLGQGARGRQRRHRLPDAPVQNVLSDAARLLHRATAAL